MIKFNKTVMYGLIIMSCSISVAYAEKEQEASISFDNKKRLAEVVAARSEDDRQRDLSRNPQQTLSFFGIQPGMSVVEVLPGGGWYSRVLAPYLGANGHLHALNYTNETWSLFGDNISQEFVKARQEEINSWPDHVRKYGGNANNVKGIVFNAVPVELENKIDAVLMIRALHNLSRFENEAGTLTRAIRVISRILKSNGIVGVVQHRAPENTDKDWAKGQNGYLKISDVIALFESQGFKLVSKSEINANPKDKPNKEDTVWRLPPTFSTTGDDQTLKAKYTEIGESDRMTLKFRKR